MTRADRQHDSSSTPYRWMAHYYDTIYSELVDYRSQADRIKKIIAKHSKKKKPGSLLDVACGTGNYTFIFADRGWKVTGIDISDEMLRIAKKKTGGKKNPRFIKMDMRKINLQEKFDVATVLFGGFGYLLETRDVESFLASVKRHLSPGGLLIFEFWQNSAVHPAASRPSGHQSWLRIEDGNRLVIRLDTSKYNAQTNILNGEYDHYILDTNGRKLVDNFSETHHLKTYAISNIRELLERSKFKVLAFYDADLSGANNDEVLPAVSATFRVGAVATPMG
jgi:ubiquinone/menaquinone biosynthesis C-methylase UbiE